MYVDEYFTSFLPLYFIVKCLQSLLILLLGVGMAVSVIQSFSIKAGVLILSLEATLQSWDEAYVGEAHHTLYDDIAKQCRWPYQAYAQYRPITQSSGMGKSRTVDELVKEHLVIPINLQTEGTGKSRCNAKRTELIVMPYRFSSRRYPSMQISHMRTV